MLTQSIKLPAFWWTVKYAPVVLNTGENHGATATSSEVCKSSIVERRSLPLTCVCEEVVALG